MPRSPYTLTLTFDASRFTEAMTRLAAAIEKVTPHLSAFWSAQARHQPPPLAIDGHAYRRRRRNR